jgi:hypothetical protein
MAGDALLIAVKPDGAMLAGNAARDGCPFPGKSHASARVERQELPRARVLLAASSNTMLNRIEELGWSEPR